MDGNAGECGSGRGGGSAINDSLLLLTLSEASKSAEEPVESAMVDISASSGERAEVASEDSEDLRTPIIEVRLNSSKRDVAKGRDLSPNNMFTAFSTKSLNSSVLRS